MAIGWLAWETTTTTGTGTYTLSGQAVNPDVARFSKSVKTGELVRYMAFVDGANWERGVGVWTSDNQLTRAAIVASTNGGLAVNWGVGTKQVKAMAGDLTTITDLLEIANNLSDVGLASAARANLGLTAFATATSTAVNFPIKMHLNNQASLLARLVARVGTVGGSHTDNGSIWISGTAIVYRDSAGNRQQFVGNPTGQFPLNALPGSIWLELDISVPVQTRLQYIDANGERRYLPSVQGAHTDVNALEGSIWVHSSDNRIHCIQTQADGQEWIEHADVAHSDTAHGDTHGDASHNDSTHSDTAHGDTHGDASHGDSPHSDTHGDTAHSDSSHQDSHSDLHCDVFEDGAGTECFIHCDHDDGASHGDAHVDHEDSFGGPCHIDGSHQDSHSDTAHSDVNHSDLHNDTHTDTGHQDTHTDVPHADSAHNDSTHTDTHSDVAFTDVPHDDRPVNLGP